MLIKKNRIPVIHIITIGMLPSFLKKIFYRAKGYKIASQVKLYPGSVLIGKHVQIGTKTSIGFFTIVRAEKIKIGRYVKIGSLTAIDTVSLSIDDDARINEQVYIGGIKTPESALIMGKRTIIMQASYINPTKPITIGDDSGIGGHCLLFTHGSWNSILEGYPVKFEPITIGKKVWLPWRVFVMPGVSIGDGSVIGADSLVTKDIPPNCLAAGSPAKVIKENFPQNPDNRAVSTIFNNLLNEFVAHLKYYNFSVTEENSNDGCCYNISKNNKKAYVYVCSVLPQTTMVPLKNSVLVITNGSPILSPGFSMAMSVSCNERIGTSPVGEELALFLSRYGVRFNRLD